MAFLLSTEKPCNVCVGGGRRSLLKLQQWRETVFKQNKGRGMEIQNTDRDGATILCIPFYYAVHRIYYVLFVDLTSSPTFYPRQ
jgi:hypothetical protein